MPNTDPLQGLSDFGLSRKSESNTVGNDNIDLEALLGNEFLDERGKQIVLEEELNRARTAEQEAQGEGGLGDLLKDPKVLAKLLAGAGIAIGAGGAGGLAVGGLLGLGGLKKGQLEQEAQRTQATKAREEAQDRLDDSNKRMDNMRNRLANMFNTNPEAFASPEGDVPDPRILGWYMTGTDIPIFPMTRRINNRRDTAWDARLNVMTTALENAQTPADRRVLVRGIFQHMDWDNPPDGMVEAMVNTTPEDFDTTLASTLLREAGPSALDAMIHAGENGLPMHHPEVLRLVSFQPPESDVTPSQQLNADYAMLLDEVNEWAKANPEQYIKMLEDIDDPEVGLTKVAQAVFADRPGDQTLFLSKANLRSSKDLVEFLQAYNMADSKLGMANMLQGLDQLPMIQNMTPEEFAQFKVNMADRLLSDTKTEAGATAANQMVALRNQTAISLVEQLGIGTQLAYETTDKIIAEALKGDDADFEANVEKLTRAVIEQNKE
jgi:PBP1b-binding outer membrane lipoprotein LpoB